MRRKTTKKKLEGEHCCVRAKGSKAVGNGKGKRKKKKTFGKKKSNEGREAHRA